ncbi:MAG: hypothetical protein EAZ99_15315 [Alphaproteobacteria bacterium]|nr:MAG: hypothetical protein EAZ99_15315 [Alphaproteobacteria bacterium]
MIGAQTLGSNTLNELAQRDIQSRLSQDPHLLARSPTAVDDLVSVLTACPQIAACFGLGAGTNEATGPDQPVDGLSQESVAALIHACIGFLLQPQGGEARLALAEAALGVAAGDVANVFAVSLLEYAPQETYDRIVNLSVVTSESFLKYGQFDPAAVSWKNLAEIWRGTAPHLFMAAKILAARGELPVWEAIYDLALWLAQYQVEPLALLFLDRLRTHVGVIGAIEHAYDEIAVKIGSFADQVSRRRQLMRVLMTELVPVTAEPNSAWDIPPNLDAPHDIVRASLSLQSHGFVVLRQAIPQAVIAETRRVLFETDADRRFVNPAQDLTKPQIEALVTPRIRGILAKFGLAGPDAATSHGRHVVPDDETKRDFLTLAFHQDAFVFFQPLFNVWVPLDSCGVSAPSLALIPDRSRDIVPTRVTETATFETGVVLDAVAQQLEAANGLIVPRFEPGDVLIFIGTVLHRTHLTEEMTQSRRSLELRFASPYWVRQPLLAWSELA